MENKYVAYVGSYTYKGNAQGITIFDVDVENGALIRRKEVPVNNASYVVSSKDKTRLYSITDDGVVTFRILPDGDLEYMATAPIRGMRGCHIGLSQDMTYLFVSGFHDGKVTILRLNPDGTAGEITDGFYTTGLGSVSETNLRPHLSCARLTPEGKYLCVADPGIDQVKIFKFNHASGRIKLVDAVRLEIDSSPRYMRFSADGRFMYVVCEKSSTICVYSYDGTTKDYPKFELIQTVSTLGKKHTKITVAHALRFSADESLVVATNNGDNSITVYNKDPETGLLDFQTSLPISGEYPKDCNIFPDNKHFVSVNYNSSTLTTFRWIPEDKYISMNKRPIKVSQPNCCAIVKLNNE